MSRLSISSRLIWRVSKVFLKTIPIIDGIPLVTPFIYLGFGVDNLWFIHALNFGPVPLDCTKRGK